MRWMHWAALKGKRGGGISLCRILVFFVFLLIAISLALWHKSPSGYTEKNQLNLQHIPKSVTGSLGFSGKRQGVLKLRGSTSWLWLWWWEGVQRKSGYLDH